VGDYVDCRPENLRTCRIVMAMVEAGSAGAIGGKRSRTIGAMRRLAR
jgi:hypothetical protein